MYDDKDYPRADRWGDDGTLPPRDSRPAGSDYWGEDIPYEEPEQESPGPGPGADSADSPWDGPSGDRWGSYDEPYAPGGADRWGDDDDAGRGPSRPGGPSRRPGLPWGRICAAALVLVLLLSLSGGSIRRLLGRRDGPAAPAVSLTPSTAAPIVPAVSLTPPTAAPIAPATSTPAPARSESAPAEDLLWYRGGLSADEQQIYDAIALALEQQSERVEGLRLPDVDRAFALYGLVLADRPDLFWADGSSSASWYPEGDGVLVDLEPRYSMTAGERQLAQQQLDAVRREILSRFAGRSDYEKVLGVYEYLIDESVYDLDDMDQSLCAVLLRHRGVCNSYAKATQYLLQQLQVPALFVAGRAGDESHAWNIVQIDGDWYQLDTTWGDPVMDDGSQIKTFTYFCLTDEEMLRDHSPDASLSYPRCTATAANWYRREGRYLERYDEEQILALMRRDLAAGEEVRLRCADETCYRDCCRALFEDGELFRLLDTVVGDYAGYNSSTDELFFELSFAPYW